MEMTGKYKKSLIKQLTVHLKQPALGIVVHDRHYSHPALGRQEEDL